jgi:hypothetical protein
LKESKAKTIDASDYWKLHKIEFADDEPLVMVELVNSTAEPDGSFKTYFLRVPPQIERARQAVAWTFGKNNERDYEPLVET